MGDYWSRLRVRLEGVPWGCEMRDCERETIRVLEQIATREVRGRRTLTTDQCRDLCRMYEADPLYVRYVFPRDLQQALGLYGNRKRNVQMNALLISYLFRAAEGLVALNVGRKMAFGLLAMLDFDTRARALRMAGKWRRQRERERDEQEEGGR